MEKFTSTETIVAMLTRNDVRRYVDNCTTHVSKAHSRIVESRLKFETRLKYD